MGPESVPIEGRYANYLKIGSNAVEFVFDFGQHVEGEPTEIVIRVFTTPSIAEEFLRVLTDAVAGWESVYGPVPPSGASDEGDMN